MKELISISISISLDSVQRVRGDIFFLISLDSGKVFLIFIMSCKRQK